MAAELELNSISPPPGTAEEEEKEKATWLITMREPRLVKINSKQVISGAKHFVKEADEVRSK